MYVPPGKLGKSVQMWLNQIRLEDCEGDRHCHISRCPSLEKPPDQGDGKRAVSQAKDRSRRSPLVGDEPTSHQQVLTANDAARPPREAPPWYFLI